MSATRQTVILGPSLIGRGNRPDLTPAHHVDFETGIGPDGARIDFRRTKPVWEKGETPDTNTSVIDINGGTHTLLKTEILGTSREATGVPIP